MTFLNIKFPDNLSIGTSGGIEFSTSISTLKNKTEIRNGNWQFPRHKYTLNLNSFSYNEYEELKAFFMLCKGKQYSFRFKDPTDYYVTNQFLGTISENNLKFQIKKYYTFNNNTITRNITKPIPNTVDILINNEKITEDFTIDYTTGIVTFNSIFNSAQDAYINFHFDTQVRFDIDYLSAQVNNFSSFNVPEVVLIEVL